jgi:hypothetical protein
MEVDINENSALASLYILVSSIGGGGSSSCVRPWVEVHVCSCLSHLHYDKAIENCHSLLFLIITVLRILFDLMLPMILPA